ncbi:DUF4350 domain-containing protein [bacterium]|nr:DUF4350 domain-containing protein [bacterium]
MKTFWSNHKAEVGWLTGLAVIVLLSFYWVPGDRNTADDTFSAATNGKKAIYRASGRLLPQTVRRSVDELVPPADTDTLVMLGPARYPDGNEWKALYEWIGLGHTLVFAARFDDPAVRPIPRMGFEIVPFEIDKMKGRKKKTNAPPPVIVQDTTPETDSVEDETSADQIQQAEANPATNTPQNVPVVSSDDDDTDDERVASGPLVEGAVSWRSRGRILPTDGYRSTTLLSCDGEPCVVVRHIGSGKLVVVSSDYVFSNRALLENSRNQQTAWRVLNAEAIDGPVYFDETMNESGTPQTFGLLFNARMRPFTLQLLLATVLFGWWGSRRFGPIARHQDATRRDIREHAVALGQLHYNVKAGGQALKNTYDRFKADMRLTSIAAESHAAVLAARSGMTEDAVADVLNRVSFGMNYHGRLPNSEAAGLIKSIAEIRERIRKRTSDKTKDK